MTTGTGTLFKAIPPEEGMGDYGLDVDLVLMSMQASRCPVLVRRDPTQTWWVIVQGPPRELHAHIIDPVTAVIDGHASPWRAALTLARTETLPWRVVQQANTDAPDAMARAAVLLADLIARHRTEEDD